MTEDTINYAYETKAIDPHATELHDSIMRGFEVYREENDRRISRLEKAKSSDVIIEEKLARIDQFMDETQKRIADLQLKSRRPLLGGEDMSHEGGIDLHRKAFNAYVRGGETATLKALESKALSAGSGPDGGFLVPPPQEREILRRMAIISPIRSLASVQSISTATFKKAYSTIGPQAGWVSETSARTQTNSQQIAELSFPAMELYAMPSATQTILDDSAVNVEEWISSEVETVFAEQEGAAFVSGDGVSKPLGFTTPVKVPQSTWAWGKLGYVATGAAGNFAASAPSDALIDLVYAVKSGYRQNATFVMNRKTQAAVRKLKMTTGEYLWQPPLTAGARASLMTFPLVEAEDMPDIAADSTPIAFGDFARGYLIVDRVGVRLLRDPYSAKPYVLFYTTKRVGGGVQDFDAIKFLKFGTA